MIFRNSNDYSGGTSISKGMTVTLDVGAFHTPLGSGAVEVFGTLQTSANLNNVSATSLTPAQGGLTPPASFGQASSNAYISNQNSQTANSNLGIASIAGACARR